MTRPIEELLRQNVENAGVDAAVVLNAVKAGKGAYGYNGAHSRYVQPIDGDSPANN